MKEMAEKKPGFLREVEESPIDGHPMHGWYCYRCRVPAEDWREEWDRYTVRCPRCGATRTVVTD